MQIPTREEINVYDSLDEQVACRNFLGKNLDEAEQLFRAAGDYYVGDLMWMGPIAFRYYVQAIIRYIQSEAAFMDWTTPLFFAGVLEFRLETEPKELASVAEQFASICGYIVESVGKFVSANDPDDLSDRYRRLREAFLKIAN